MKQLIAGLCILFTVTACTLSPKPLGNEARSQSVNSQLICAQQIDIQPISINGTKPPKKAFDFSMNKLKKYTTQNVVVHETINLTIKEKEINFFIHDYGARRDVHYLNIEDKELFDKALAKIPTSGTSFIMIYTPRLSHYRNGTKQSRGIAFYNDEKYKVVAYNQTTIHDAPVLSDTQAWKIVLTHELGHQFKVPANKSHNKDGHCTSRECIMYSSPDWQSVLSVILLNGMPYDFCDKCKAELKESKKSCDGMHGTHPDSEPIWQKKEEL